MKYNIGDKFWRVSTKLNWNSNKIKMTDADGIEWYRYPNGKNIYSIDKLEIVGKILHSFEGNSSLWMENEYVDRYAVRVNDGHLEDLYEEDINEYYTFDSLEAAQALVNKLRKEE